MNKWILFEVAQARSASAFKSEHIKELTTSLPGLYFKAFETISLIHKVPKTNVLSLLIQDQIPGIERSLSELERYDRTCATQKERVDIDLKSLEENSKLLKWVKGDKNPEPSHKSVKFQTGIEKGESQAAAWFLNTSVFKSWRDGLASEKAERVFWLKGIMGSGKTTLICRLISYFEVYPIHETRVVFYYCYGSATEKQNQGPSYEEIIRGLCRRLAWNDGGEIAQPAKEFYQQCTSLDDQKPHTNRWEQLLRDLIIHSKERILFIIDALDECSAKADRRKFLKFVRDMQQHGVYMILSSRPHAEVDEYFKTSTIRYSVVTTEAKADMEVFINDEISRIRTDPSHSQSAFLENENLELLSATLINQANGMFRWAQLWLGVFFNPNHESVVLKKTAKGMLEMLQKGAALPTNGDGNDMAQVYQQLWDINGDGDEDRKLRQIRAFRFVLAADEPLQTQTLLDAIRFDPEAPTELAKEIDVVYLRKLFHNFLLERSGRLEFEHVSAKTFILNMQDPASKHVIFDDDLENHRTIAETSLLLLRNPDHELWKEAHVHWNSNEVRAFIRRHQDFDEAWERAVLAVFSSRYDVEELARKLRDPDLRLEFRLDKERLNASCLALYVLYSWSKHCCKIHDNGLSASFRRLLLDTLRDRPVTLNYLEAMRVNQLPAAADIDPLIFALSHGLSPFHSPGGGIDLTPNLGDIMARNSVGETTLHIAVRKNDHRSVKALLHIHSEADSNVPLLYSVDNEGNNVLHVATKDEIVMILLEFESKWAKTTSLHPDKLQDSELLQTTNERLKTPLENLAFYCSEDLIMAIMERFEVKASRVTGALRRRLWPTVIRRGFKRVIRLLLDRGAAIDDIALPYGTSLSIAAACGNEDMAAFLIQQGADLNGPGGDYGTPLGAAVHFVQGRVVDLLMQHEVDLDQAVRLSPDSDDKKWNRVGGRFMKVANVLQERGRRYDPDNVGALKVQFWGW
ncbi:hypothetical protein PFICI_12313 [Pestalotiopsis fici W106-1]|uniref:NACHT domain-containing protein n=1 Tax=Pestalotiopsis fici (strain W106-1 / CGMCC3.15140) TaxID=1229662 RepID=W3WNK6_PESFW|nr:uncharacterized protein PFICI_12313 [Pestalotiopsis fici W106-1]ETS75369.1 hypothetical protein PFICI_12313 [Pestalotiopsis fici W106-1]